MSDPVLPPEICDYILDLLPNEPETLKQCSLVAKSWIPRTRRYLFADIRFNGARELESWSKTFPDPTNSPASHVRTLEIDCYPEDLEGVDWIGSFSCVVQLRLFGHSIPLALFYGFSYNLKSLHIEFSCPELLKFICSFPLLENLTLLIEEVSEDYGNEFHELQTSPLLTGSLALIASSAMLSASRQLLSLPNGLRFRELVICVVEDDLRWIQELVLRCSDTLECLDIKHRWSSGRNFIDFSKATKLKDLRVRSRRLDADRVIAMLETITVEHRDLRQVSIDFPFQHILPNVGDEIYEKWLRLDRLLVQIWELHSVRTKVVVTESMNGRISSLFPEVTARGIIDVAEEH